MAVALVIRDETMAGKTLAEWSLDFLTERINVRELIRSRVYQEVQDYNLKQTLEFRGLVQPADAEQTSGGYRLKKARQIDWQEQFARATEAFEQNRILILINNRQAESLEEEFSIEQDTTVSFLKLTPLVGG